MSGHEDTVREALLARRHLLGQMAGSATDDALDSLDALTRERDAAREALRALLFVVEDEPEAHDWPEVIAGRAALAPAEPHRGSRA